MLSISVLLLACSEDWTCNLQMIVSWEAQGTNAYNHYAMCPAESTSCLNFWDEAWWFLSLRVFGLSLTVMLCVLLDNSEWIFGTYKLNVLTWLGLLLLCMIFFFTCAHIQFFFFLKVLVPLLLFVNKKVVGLPLQSKHLTGVLCQIITVALLSNYDNPVLSLFLFFCFFFFVFLCTINQIIKIRKLNLWKNIKSKLYKQKHCGNN